MELRKTQRNPLKKTELDDLPEPGNLTMVIILGGTLLISFMGIACFPIKKKYI